MLKEALPVIMQCRLMEMIELKPWKHSAKRAATPEAEALARQVRQGARAQKIEDKLRARRRGNRLDRDFTGKELNLQPRLWQRVEDAHIGVSRARLNDRELAKASADADVRRVLRDANESIAHKKVTRSYDYRGGVGLAPGDKIGKIHGRPSPASKKPEGPQDLRLNPPKKKPWYQFWGGKEAPKPEPMDVKAPLVRKRYFGESSIVRRGCLMEREYIKGGKAAGMDVKRFPKQQLRMGTKVEHEHTPKAGIAQEIAKDHLAEFPDYYTRLRKMEHKAARALRGKRALGVKESVTHKAILQETSRLVRELMSGRLNAKNVGRVRSAGILRSPETMEQGLDAGSRELAKRHRIAKMPKELKMGDLPMSLKTSSLRGIRSDLFQGGGVTARELAPLDKVVGTADRRNLKGYANIPKDSGPLARRHEIDEVRSKSPKMATIVGRNGEMAGKHSGLDVLARERENAIRLGVHGSKVPHTPSKYTGDKSILAARHGTGEYELVKKHAGESELPLTPRGRRNLARAKPDATDDLGGSIFHVGKQKNTRVLPRNFLGGRSRGVVKPESFNASRYKGLRNKWGNYSASSKLAPHGKRGGKMRELKHEITESIVRRGILKEGFLKPPMRRALSDVKKVGTGFVKDLVPVDWMAADGWKGKAKGAVTELASYGAGKLTGLPVVPYHTGAAAMDVAKKRQAIQARYKRMKQASMQRMSDMEEVPVKFTRPNRAKPLWAGNHGMRGVE